MARSKKHKDVEFHVTGRETTTVFKTFKDAAERAVILAASGGMSVIDVVVWSRSGARWYAGEHGVEMYNEDPDASVFERLELHGNVVGRIS